MKNEIKEILEYYKWSNKNKFGYEQDKIITYKEAQILLDYITNLQEENERLKKRNKEIYDGFIATQEELSDYVTRNEKAKSLTNRTIEIIKQQPSGNDEWILERLNGINYCLGGDEE